MSFTQSLRKDAALMFDAIYRHAFIQGISQGRLSRESLIHYVRQDTLYLNTYSKAYAYALTKSHTQDQMRLFYQRIGVSLEGEVIPHRNLCQVAGVDLEEVTKSPSKMAPTTHHYARHVLSVAQQGTLGETVAVVLPCHWIYVDLCKRITTENLITIDHPFYEWITFYSSDTMVAGLTELTTLLDDLAESAGELDRYLMKSAFLDSCRLEYQFFDMAVTLEQWVTDPSLGPSDANRDNDPNLARKGGNAGV